ncbi:MAG TPA: hypothetical protein VL547_08335 [Dinghuibacter sp.]|uniref:hypothetical protein n=1 Tax=Dinghuibacter sp. TaxID=2024697 RepID=UPI002C5A4958|nr:hypothetical protein [Dinghuibacter sp.]HTJ12018.1 hypothetical protein [Dinghuibacter sp.]
MKKFAILCAFMAIVCAGMSQFHVFKKKEAVQDTTGTAVKKPVAKKKNKHEILPLRSYYTLTGKVRDTSKVFLWMAIRDSVIKGVVRYGRVGESLYMGDSLAIYGTVEKDGRLLFCTFSKDGDMSNGFAGKIIDDSVFQGQWFSMTSNLAHACNLFRIDSVPTGVDTNLVTERVEGTYSYHLGDLGAAGGIIIKKEAAGVISIDLGCAGGPPDYASAMVKSSQIPFDGTNAEYDSPGRPGCKLRIRVFKDFVVIGYLHGLGTCGYGTSVEGVFARVK